MSDPRVETGFYAIDITLDDGKNQVLETVIVDIRDPAPLEEEQKEVDLTEELDIQLQSDISEVNTQSVEIEAVEKTELTE